LTGGGDKEQPIKSGEEFYSRESKKNPIKHPVENSKKKKKRGGIS